MDPTISLVDLTRGGGTLSCMMGCPLVCRLPLQLDRMPSAIASFPVQPHSARVLVGDAHFFHARAHAVPVFPMLRYPLVEDPIGYRSFPLGSDPPGVSLRLSRLSDLLAHHNLGDWISEPGTSEPGYFKFSSLVHGPRSHLDKPHNPRLLSCGGRQ